MVLAATLREMKKTHPRLLGGSDPAALAKKNAKSVPGKLLADKILRDAVALLDVPVSERIVVGRRMLRVSRQVLYRVNTLAMAYFLTDDVKYARRAAAEMTAAAQFTDWNPAHFLDTAEMTSALAVGYDFLYDRLTSEERALIEESIIGKGLKPSLADNQKWWWTGCNNWTQVCHAGNVAGALAIYEKDPEFAQFLIEEALKYIPVIMKLSYYPEGAYPEGPMYWSYGTDFNVLLMALLENALSDDFGLAELPGFSRTCDFIDAMETPSGYWFTYSDCRDVMRSISLSDLYLTKRFKRGDRCSKLLALLKRYAAEPAALTGDGERLMPLALLLLPDAPEKTQESAILHYYSGDESGTPVAVHRLNSSSDATYLALKAGSPSGSHGHMDAGSFLFESGGVCWAEDLGLEGYHELEKRGIRLWDGSQNGDRWKIFRLGKNSHNILIIDGENQTVKGNAKITSSSERVTEMDLTGVYAGKVQKAVRRAELMPDGSITITDTLSGLKPESIVKWQMCTKSDIGSGDAPGTLKLSMRGKTMCLHAETSKNPAVFKITPWRQLAGENDSDNGSTSMITFDSKPDAKGDLVINVTFKCGGSLRPLHPQGR